MVPINGVLKINIKKLNKESVKEEYSNSFNEESLNYLGGDKIKQDLKTNK